jgi:Flp pilus assembly pilin Flp
MFETNFIDLIRTFGRDELAGSLAENAVLLALITVGVMGGITACNQIIRQLIDYLGSVFEAAV